MDSGEVDAEKCSYQKCLTLTWCVTTSVAKASLWEVSRTTFLGRLMVKLTLCSGVTQITGGFSTITLNLNLLIITFEMTNVSVAVKIHYNFSDLFDICPSWFDLVFSSFSSSVPLDLLSVFDGVRVYVWESASDPWLLWLEFAPLLHRRRRRRRDFFRLWRSFRLCGCERIVRNGIFCNILFKCNNFSPISHNLRQ